MSPRLAAALEKIRTLAEQFNHQNPPLKKLWSRAFSEDPDHASSAIHRIAREYDVALAAIAWTYFWVRQGDLLQARHELEKVEESGNVETLWGGLALMLFGELLIETGEPKEGAKRLERAESILGEPR
ncbi:MAG: hypothetical protein O2960_18120 [Verrucomicrobia bacterium]|nr:hypothetical protein [Verrucomicrobiota bacterium]